jgi:hypothetical protein
MNHWRGFVAGLALLVLGFCLHMAWGIHPFNWADSAYVGLTYLGGFVLGHAVARMGGPYR